MGHLRRVKKDMMEKRCFETKEWERDRFGRLKRLVSVVCLYSFRMRRSGR